jgi:SnoaL-like domain
MQSSSSTSDAAASPAGEGEESLHRQLRALVDRAAVSDLIDRFNRDLDDYTLEGRSFDVDWARSYFTESATVDYPVGQATGAEEIAELIDGQGMAPFQRTHHVTTNHLVDLDGDRAAVRFNLIATHVFADDVRERLGESPGARFTVGDYYEGEAVRTETGWRFNHQTLHVTWTDGTPPATAAH